MEFHRSNARPKRIRFDEIRVKRPPFACRCLFEPIGAGASARTRRETVENRFAARSLRGRGSLDRPRVSLYDWIGQERWLSGRKRQFAKLLNWETGSAGSNPALSVHECRRFSKWRHFLWRIFSPVSNIRFDFVQRADFLSFLSIPASSSGSSVRIASIRASVALCQFSGRFPATVAPATNVLPPRS